MINHESFTGSLNGIHVPHEWEFADAAARASATNPNTGYAYITADLKKLAYQIDTKTFWVLTAVTPTWTPIYAMATDLSIASQAAGDVIYFNGTNWVRLAKDAGKYLKSGASAVSWDTPAGGATTHAIMVFIGGTVYVADNIIWVRAPYAMTLSKIRLGLQTKGTGTGSTKAKITYHATDPSSAATIFSTGPETNAPACTSSDYTDDSGTPDVTSVAAGGWIGIGFSAVCATTPGSNAVIEILET